MLGPVRESVPVLSADGVIRLTDRIEIIHRIRGGNAVFLAIPDRTPSRPRGYVQAAREVLAAASAMTRGDPSRRGARLIELREDEIGLEEVFMRVTRGETQ